MLDKIFSVESDVMSPSWNVKRELEIGVSF